MLMLYIYIVIYIYIFPLLLFLFSFLRLFYSPLSSPYIAAVQNKHSLKINYNEVMEYLILKDVSSSPGSAEITAANLDISFTNWQRVLQLFIQYSLGRKYGARISNRVAFLKKKKKSAINLLIVLGQGAFGVSSVACTS